MPARIGSRGTRSLALLALVGLLALSPIAALAQESAVEVVGFASPEKANDFGWNQQGLEGAQQAAERVGARLEVADGIGYENVGPALRELADGGAQLIIAHAAGYGTIGAETAELYSVPVLVFNNPDAMKPGLVADVRNLPQEGSYLAGVLAATMTQTGVIGIAASADVTTWNRMAGGFVAGARSVNEDIVVRHSLIGPGGFADVAGGKRVTDSIIAAGADIILGMGDGSSFGMIQSVETASPPPGADKVWFIDVIGDKQSLDQQNVYLSSVLWDFSTLFEQAMRDVAAGTFGEAGYEVSIRSGNVSLLQTDHVTEDARSAVEAARAAIVDGSADVPNIETADQLRELIGQ
ncbi:BMP family protein [soil metagenome]